MLNVKKLMSEDVRVCHPNQSLETATQMMRDGDFGCLPVCGNETGQVIGMITDRDICMHGLSSKRPLGESSVGDAMSGEAVTCQSSDSLAKAEQIMQKAQVRRLPVVSDGGVIEGIISLADIAEEAARSSAFEPDVTESEVGETLSAICVPRAA